MNKGKPQPASKPPGQTVFLAVVVVGSCVVLGYMLFGGRPSSGNAAAAASRLRLEDVPFDGERAYGYLKQLCAIGRRPSGSPGMAAQQKLLRQHFTKHGGRVEFQRFRIKHPVDGSPVPITNIIVHWHPDRKQRILLCTHYDTLPYPLRDPVDRRGKFVGANDGASGVAILMELARQMPKLNTRYGVDFALFDAEEFVFREDGRYMIGSRYFAQQYANSRPTYRYRWGVLLDMVGDKDLQIYQEGLSMQWKDTRPLVEDIWAIARRLGVREFIPRTKYAIQDDHLQLHEIGKIPCCNVIDYDYPAWHTRQDTPEQCSALSLAKVGWVIREWLKAAR